MNIPNSLKEQLREDYFVHDKILVVYFSCTEFDAVEDPKKAGQSGSKQYVGNLPACTDDIEDFKEAMKHYGATDPADCYHLHNPSRIECTKTFGRIGIRLEKNPEVNHLIMYVFAGHGMNKYGQQVVLVNEFDT